MQTGNQENILVAKYKTVFKSKEEIFGVLPRSREGVCYKGTLTVKDGGITPVSLKMTFVPPHPFVFEMPESHSIKAESITDAYAKVVKFFKKYGIEFR